MTDKYTQSDAGLNKGSSFVGSWKHLLGRQVIEQVNDKLEALLPLTKIHYSFGTMGGGMVNDRDDIRLYEGARICHSLGFWGWGCTFEQVDNCVYACARVNETSPEIPSSVAVTLKPWHRKFGAGLPPTDRGETYDEELSFLLERLNYIKDWVATSNALYSSDVEVSALLLDSERFAVKQNYEENYEEWNAAITECLDAYQEVAVGVFPDVRLEWYDRGIRRFNGNRFGMTSHWTGEEIAGPLSCCLYTIPESECMRETYRRTCDLADIIGDENTLVTPWVALASGYLVTLGWTKRWAYDWDYDLSYSFNMGATLAQQWYADRPDRFAAYDRGETVVFYPGLFDSRVDHWSRHFIAYVRGATSVGGATPFGVLNDLGYVYY